LLHLTKPPGVDKKERHGVFARTRMTGYTSIVRWVVECAMLFNFPEFLNYRF